MNSDHLPNIHPGEILKLDFLEPLNITPYRLSKDLSVAQTRIGEILAGKQMWPRGKAQGTNFIWEGEQD